MELVVASNNAHKVKEIRQILGEKFPHILTLKELGVEIEVEEDGETFFANARKKASEVCRATGKIALADDTGLLVDALNGEPGVYSARYAGEQGNDAANNEKLLKNLSGIACRTARFFTSVVLFYPNGSYAAGSGSVEGEILKAPRGLNGFGYDALFYCTELGKTFGEATDEEKNAVSHRARALADLVRKL